LLPDKLLGIYSKRQKAEGSHAEGKREKALMQKALMQKAEGRKAITGTWSF
jgi:hypothetical protein